MYVVCIHVYVKPEHREEFIRASLDNARGTIQEPGNLRFDVIQRLDEPNRFMLYEVYRDQSGVEAHKATPHYARWRDAVANWMAEPRQGIKHTALFPEDPSQWATRK
jgi:autoinducer 2-degrading protein